METGVHLDPAVKEVQYNPTYETMFAPEVSSKPRLSLKLSIAINTEMDKCVLNSLKTFLIQICYSEF